MKKDEYKKEVIDRIKSEKAKDFKSEKVKLSSDDPILQSTKRMAGDIPIDYVIRQAEAFLNASPDPNFGYKGRKTRTIIKVVESPGKFYGVRFGKIRIGIWCEVERDEQ
ncbi:hypothetical protein [Bacillus sp. OK048]|uniref:hypothetical protein n=1 Tax=Bacillus sp. OK048 TaxID=1882761 RepID=UPI00088297B8|nr:hypothetical protein [Bacillus sp. OK048]SDM41858.1 hypothetical protein SAMN05443253_103244 [Bacillus sp. OK048]